MPELVFEVLIDDALASVTTAAHLKAALNKQVLSLINDFEDGAWRFPKFQKYLWDNIAQTALSQRERLALIDQSHSTLVAAAKNLRLTDNDKIGKGSEIAEVFLYGLMQHQFNALPVVPKIFYKQSVQDNAKGADSVHIVVDGDDFSLWFGEAKFYNSIADARLDDIIDSVLNSLSSDKLRKENSIITSLSDIDELPLSATLKTNIKAALSNRNSIDEIKSRINIPILLLHECSTTAAAQGLSDAYRAEIAEFHKDRATAYFTKQLAQKGKVHKYDDVRFHIILFPVPSKKKIVDAFVDVVTFYKGQG